LHNSIFILKRFTRRPIHAKQRAAAAAVIAFGLHLMYIEACCNIVVAAFHNLIKLGFMLNALSNAFLSEVRNLFQMSLS